MKDGVWVRVSEPSEAVRRYLRNCVRIDTRTLAVFRVALALLIVADLLLRSRNFSTFYTDGGLVPHDLARETAPLEAPSVYLLSAEPAVTAALFVVHGLIALALLVGYRTRIATVLSFVFVVSLDLANPLVLSYADVLFAWLLCWATLLPLGERWSIDAVHADGPPRRSVASLGSALVLLQMITMYTVNGYHKTASELWLTGEAAVLVLGLDDMTFLLGDLVRSAPTALQIGGLTWLLMLSFSSLLLLARGRFRTTLVAAFVAAHLSFALTVRIGAFAYVAIAGVVLFLQSSFWADCSKVARRFPVPTEPLETTRVRLESIARAVPRPGLGFDPNTRIPQTLTDATRPLLVAVFATVLLVSVLSAGGVVDDDTSPAAEIDAATAAVVDHQTDWYVFAPEPRTTDRYYVFPAKTAAGDVVDVYNDRELSYERPADDLQRQYGTYRERFYMNSVATPDHPDVPVRLAESICSDRSEGDDAITHLEMYLIEEDVTLETIDEPSERTREATLLSRHSCGDDEPEEIAPPPF
ncbi:HTTM domain-containing protein [Natrialba sp. INN-245]|uniref:HTTM domain-containing protein n=1 Tax=Natrialba sp. INN-245 TaxID=2690967 RepID=UPI001312195C|nr:HTTM domain-containing protein [Natrialba sp. INN-245]MWV40804.1 HTTM domain-containing protein [Natrialba sp. INN-245]